MQIVPILLSILIKPYLMTALSHENDVNCRRDSLNFHYDIVECRFHSAFQEMSQGLIGLELRNVVFDISIADL
jgi:hypothetical protein